jgi:hypothetical protein
MGSLATSTSGLSLRCLTTTLTSLGLLGTWGGTEMMDFEYHLLDLLDFDEMTDGVDHTANLWAIFFHDDITDPLETERSQSLTLTWDVRDLGANLGDLESWHDLCTSLRCLAR